jgi:hypothetical protein
MPQAEVEEDRQMSNWFPLDIAIGAFVMGVSLFILAHQALGILRRSLDRHSTVSDSRRYRFTCEQH